MQNPIQEEIIKILSDISNFVWGLPLIALLLGTGVYLTIILKGLQFRALIPSLYIALIKRKEERESEGDISQFQALMTALAATVGVGNIAGVATAIAVGGPGAMFWMWITGLFGMATKYSEAVLALKYREVDKFGTMSGGPMYYISKGLGLRWLGTLFAIFASIAAFGIGNMVQSNSVADALNTTFGVSHWVSGVVMCIATGLVVIGGIKSIAKAATVIVPFMIVFYMIGSFISIFVHWQNVPDAFRLIFYHAFTPTAAAGGVIIASGVWDSGKTGASLSTFAFEQGIPTRIGDNIVAISLAAFAYSTILGWCYYGEKAIEYLFKERAVKPYRILFTVVVMAGAVMKLDLVWTFADIMNGLMAFPNLVGLLGLSRVVVEETKKYLELEISGRE